MQPADPATMPTGDAEARIAILTDVIARVLGSPEPVLYTALFQSVMEATGRAEEDVGPDIQAAVAVCVLNGLFLSESFQIGQFTMSRSTTLRPSKWATRFVWRETCFDPADDEPPDRIA